MSPTPRQPNRRLSAWAALLLTALLAPSSAPAATPPELDVLVERFKVATEREARLDLAYQAMDKYAPLKDKSAMDRDDRDALSEMKRLIVMDLVRSHRGSAMLTAIGSGGTWLVEPQKIKNDYDEADADATARYKYQGFYMEGLSDLDLEIMGSEARAVARAFHDALARGRGGADLVPKELDELELNFLVDDQIQDLSGGGDRRKFWKQTMHLSRSALHPEKYITKGGKALYCVEHLGERGAALALGEDPGPCGSASGARGPHRTSGRSPRSTSTEARAIWTSSSDTRSIRPNRRRSRPCSRSSSISNATRG